MTETRVEDLAETIFSGLDEHHGNFGSLTRRAKGHFERREWALQQADAAERLSLHKHYVQATVARCEALLESVGESRKALWRAVRRRYACMIDGLGGIELAETFFNSVTRRVFGIIGVDDDLEFRWFGPELLMRGEGGTPILRAYDTGGDTAQWVTQVLRAFANELSTPFHDLERDAALVSAAVEEHLLDTWDTTSISGADTLLPIFFRNKGAYIVGRLRYLNRVSPFVLPLSCGPSGIEVDTVLLTEAQASRVFGFTRSYFQVEWENPAEVVGYLKSLLPMKSIHELYTSIGHNQHGKTAMYRSLYRHMRDSTDKFQEARGTRGLVMIVFTLPSYPVVFKVIRDHFAPPKMTTRAQVEDSYRLVFGVDRVGRMLDAQEFEQLAFARDRFAPELLEVLSTGASRSVDITDDQVVIKHTYTERRVYPLNLYMREMGSDRALRAALDYGEALRDLSAANIFPGDLLPKNFGVTRHGDVVFYDYDEVSRLDGLNFREIPDTDDYDATMAEEPWYRVGPHDVFPEQFRSFLRFNTAIEPSFLDAHDELFHASYWRDIQVRHAKGVLPDFYPYATELRFDTGRVVS